MLHVRVTSPRVVTGRLVGDLAARAGVRNLVVHEGGARHPDGDAIQFDLLTSSANEVLHRLRELHLDHEGSITVSTVDVVIDGRPAGPRQRGAFRAEREPVWEVVNATIRANAVYAPSFYGLLALAGLIAAVGILTNSQILIVGAMVVGPEYAAIISVALGLTTRDHSAVRAGLAALLWGFLAAIILTYCFAWSIRAADVAPAAFLSGVRPVASLLNSPNLFSVIVAFLAGIVGVVSLTESRASALIGVFISVTTIPAAASIGVSAAFVSWSAAGGSLLQLLLNVVVLTAVGAGGLALQRAIWRRPGGGRDRAVTGQRSG